MKRAKLSFSNIILITACLVVVVSILFLNVINTRNIITLKNSIDTLSIENKNISLLRNASDELVGLELVFTKYLQTKDASLIEISSGLVQNTLKHFQKLKQESDPQISGGRYGRGAVRPHRLPRSDPGSGG